MNTRVVERVSVFLGASNSIEVPVKFGNLLDPEKLMLRIENVVLNNISYPNPYRLILTLEGAGSADQSGADGSYNNELARVYTKSYDTHIFDQVVTGQFGTFGIGQSVRLSDFGYKVNDMFLTNNNRIKFGFVAPHNTIINTVPGEHGAIITRWGAENQPLELTGGGLAFDAVFYTHEE